MGEGRSARVLLVLGGALVLATACGLTIEGVASTNGDGGVSTPDGSPPGTPDPGIADAGGDAGAEEDCGAGRDNARACGRCGRDCGGGTCVDARCTPYVISDGGVAGPWYLSVDETRVYVTGFTGQGAQGSDGDLYAIPKAGGPSEKLATFNNAFDVLAAGDVIIVSSLADDGLFSVPKQKPNTAKKVWTGAQSLDLDRVDGVTYFTSRGTNNDGVHRLEADGGVTDLLTTLPKDADIEGIAVDDTFVYYALRRGEIGRMRRDGTENNEHWHVAPNVRRLTVDDEALYWTRDARAHRLSKDGALESTLAEGVGLGRVSVDRAHAYITLDTEGRVVRVNKRDGTGKIELATNLKRPIGLADDGKTIFFTEYSSARVWAMRK